MSHQTTRRRWIHWLERIVLTPLTALAEGRLKREMPVECQPGCEASRRQFTHLEALGRSLCGLAPFLALSRDEFDPEERAQQQRLTTLSQRAIASAVTPGSPDRLNFDQGDQPVVDAAFLAQAILRAPQPLFHQLDHATRTRLVEAMKATRRCTAHYNNWLLFAGIIEAALAQLDEDFDAMRIDYAIRQHMAWYKGDGFYGDGPTFHADYYNSFVIHPMLVDVIRAVGHHRPAWQDMTSTILERARRYAAILERSISPDGHFPPVGRSLAYRCGVFHALAQSALLQRLPDQVQPPQVRGALTAVIGRMLDAPATFDDAGWLRIGFVGHQPGIGEPYISTGSLYLATAAFLPLGLPPTDPFWSAPDCPWTSRQLWNGLDLHPDHAIDI